MVRTHKEQSKQRSQCSPTKYIGQTMFIVSYSWTQDVNREKENSVLDERS